MPDEMTSEAAAAVEPVLLMTDLGPLIRFDCWCNHQCLLPALAQVPRGVETAGHIAGISELWLSRCEGREPQFGPWPGFSLPELSVAFDQLERRWLARVGRSASAELVHYRTGSGAEARNTLGELVLEVCFHAAHHRGQIVLLLRTNGHEPPKTLDLVPAARSQPFTAAQL